MGMCLNIPRVLLLVLLLIGFVETREPHMGMLGMDVDGMMDSTDGWTDGQGG
jgi:hypothetical protein